MIRRVAAVAAILFAAVLVPVTGQAQDATVSVSYSIIDFGPLTHLNQDDCASDAPGATINQIGAGNQAVGSTYIDDERAVAAMYSADGVRRMESGAGGGAAEAINQDGMIAGTVFAELPAENCGSPTEATPALWNDEFELTELSLPDEASEGGAHAINDSGIIAGWVETDDGMRAAIWNDDDVTVMSMAGIAGFDSFTSEVADINGAGVVAGTASWVGNDQNRSQPFIWDGVSVQYLDPFLGRAGYANAINTNGLVAGAIINDQGREEAAIWSEGQLVDLDTLPDRPTSVATDINSGGIAVGYCARDDGLSRATIWLNGSVIDLNEVISEELGWQLQVAIGINDDGTIAGWGDLDGERHAYLLVPAAG